MWYTIAFVSTTNPKLIDSEIRELLTSCRLYNNENCITGILMYSEGNFFQILEGDKGQIEILFSKIKQDSRHYGLLKIVDHSIENTVFSKYYCSFTSISNNTNSQMELNLFLSEERIHNPEDYEEISYITQKFTEHSLL